MLSRSSLVAPLASSSVSIEKFARLSASSIEALFFMYVAGVASSASRMLTKKKTQKSVPWYTYTVALTFENLLKNPPPHPPPLLCTGGNGASSSPMHRVLLLSYAPAEMGPPPLLCTASSSSPMHRWKWGSRSSGPMWRERSRSTNVANSSSKTAFFETPSTLSIQLRSSVMLHAFPRPFLPPAGVGILSIVTQKTILKTSVDSCLTSYRY